MEEEEEEEETYHHASKCSIGRHGQVPHGVPCCDLGVDKHDQQSCASSEAGAHCGTHSTPAHHLQEANHPTPF